MSARAHLLQLFKDKADLPALTILKKLIMACDLGWFRIYGQAPDSKVSLSEYLLDDERLILDFSHTSETAKKEFMQWLYGDNANEAEQEYFIDAKSNEYRGFMAEVGLSLWGKILNFIFRRTHRLYWKVQDASLLNTYRIHGVDLMEGEHGLLLGIRQQGRTHGHDRYSDPMVWHERPHRNAKRCFLNDDIVKALRGMDVTQYPFEQILSLPQRYALPVKDKEKRYDSMEEHQKGLVFLQATPWYIRFWQWVLSFFSKPTENHVELKEFNLAEHAFVPVADLDLDTLNVKHNPKSGEVQVFERRPKIDTVVFCGGGSKIYGHVGAIKAFEALQIRPTRFAGSSAGAIMALLQYLGLDSNGILDYFVHFKEENLIFYELHWSGISSSQALKSGLDCVLMKRLHAIIQKYHIDKTEDGRLFLERVVFKNNKVSFAGLKALKARYPDCGIGDELIVTGTNMQERETTYFSFSHTPDMDIIEAAVTSASFPIMFKPNELDGAKHNDGGVLSNFPAEVFRDDGSTFLASQHGNCLRLVGLQFDNGTERPILEKLVPNVYRENFLLNGLYALLTGVRDPATGWERDRLKLMKHSNQVILINCDGISSSNFNLSAEQKERLQQNGFESAMAYLKARYSQNKYTQEWQPSEYIYQRFASVTELVHYAAVRGCPDILNKLAQSKTLRAHFEPGLNIEQLMHNCIKATPSDGAVYLPKQASRFGSFFSNVPNKDSNYGTLMQRMELFLAIYPLLLYIEPRSFFCKPIDQKRFWRIRHECKWETIGKTMQALAAGFHEQHIIFAALQAYLRAYAAAEMSKTAFFEGIAHCVDVLSRQGNPFLAREYYVSCTLPVMTADVVLDLLEEPEKLQRLASMLGKKEVPLQRCRTVEQEEPIIPEYANLSP